MAVLHSDGQTAYLHDERMVWEVVQEAQNEGLMPREIALTWSLVSPAQGVVEVSVEVLHLGVKGVLAGVSAPLWQLRVALAQILLEVWIEILQDWIARFL